MKWRKAVSIRFLKLLAMMFFMGLLFFPGCQRDEAQKIFDKGLTLWEDEKYDEAIQNFVALTKAFPEHHLVDDSLFWIANIYEHYLNNAEQTIRFYRYLTGKFENSEFQFRSMVGLGRVRALQGEEGKRKAIRIFRKLQKHPEIIQNEKKWVENQFRLIDLFFELKEYEQTRIELKQVILKETGAKSDSKAYYLIGRSYLLEGNTELAKITFLEADRKFKFKRVSLDSAINLADIYEQSGDLRLAITVYDTILKRLERKEVFYQLATDRKKKLNLRLKKTKTG